MVEGFAQQSVTCSIQLTLVSETYNTIVARSKAGSAFQTLLSSLLSKFAPATRSCSRVGHILAVDSDAAPLWQLATMSKQDMPLKVMHRPRDTIL